MLASVESENFRTSRKYNETLCRFASQLCLRVHINSKQGDGKQMELEVRSSVLSLKAQIPDKKKTVTFPRDAPICKKGNPATQAFATQLKLSVIFASALRSAYSFAVVCFVALRHKLGMSAICVPDAAHGF